MPSYYYDDERGLESLIGRTITVRTRAEGNMKNTMDPDFWERQAAAALAKAEILRNVPQSDTFEDGSLLTFSKVLSGTMYHYAAIKAGGYWYVSGNSAPNRITWDVLIEFIGVHNLSTLSVVDTRAAVSMADYVKGVQAALEKTGEDK